jgi:hypothetical protein
MNKRGLEMAISTLVIIVLGIMLLVAMTISFTLGWKKFWGIISGYFGSDVDNLQKICQNQCNMDFRNSFCCENKTLGKEKITCLDERLKVQCNLDCTNVC